MGNDVKVVIVFLVAVAVICILWNMLMMKFDKRNELLELEASKQRLNFCIDSNEKMVLVGTGLDGNSDYEVEKAIKKIKLGENVRIKINE